MRLATGFVFGVLGVCRAAAAQTITPSSEEPPASVAAEQHSLADAVEPHDSFSIRRPSQQRADETKAARRWYGAPILVTDGVAYALLATAIANEKSAPVVLPLSLAAYTLGGPITHGAHGNWGRAGISLLTRASLPLAGAVVGASGCTGNSGDCVSGAASLAVVGMAVASIIDIAALSWEPVAAPRAGSLQPSLVLRRDSAWTGASITF